MNIFAIGELLGRIDAHAGSPQRLRAAQSRSALEGQLRAVIRNGASTPDQRQRAVGDMWRCRTHIESEKRVLSACHAVSHLRSGEWGPPRLKPRLACMPYIVSESEEMVIESGSIQAEAQTY